MRRILFSIGFIFFGLIILAQPSVTSLSIPASPMKVDDVITATITVVSDPDDYTSGSGGITGTIGGFTVSGVSFTKNSDTEYTVQFTITEGGSDVADGDDITVNVTLTNSSGTPGSAYTTAISQAGDAIDANSPTVSAVSIPASNSKVGDAITVTITASEAGLSLSSGSVNSVSVTGFSDDGGGSYSATYTVGEGDTDRASGDDIPVNFVLDDAAGNSSTAFTTAISQAGDAIDANTPTITSVDGGDASFGIGGPHEVTIIVEADDEDYSTGMSGSYGGRTLGNFSKTNNTTYTAEFALVEGVGTEYASTDNIPVVLDIDDAAGNSAAQHTTDDTGETIDVNRPTLTNLKTFDTTNDGLIDRIDLTFDEDIEITDGTGDLADLGTLTLPDGNTASGATVPDASTSSVLSITNITGQVTKNTGSVNTADINGLLVRDLAGNVLTDDDNETKTDGALPVIVAANLMSNSLMDIDWSELVYGANDGSTPLASNGDDFTINITGTVIAESITALTDQSYNTITAGETNLRFDYTYSGAAAGGETVTISPASNAVYDAAGNIASTTQSNNTGSLATDTNPTVTLAQWNDSDGSGGIDQLVLKFSDRMEIVSDVAGDGLPCLIIRNNGNLVSIANADYNDSDIKTSEQLTLTLSPEIDSTYITYLTLEYDDAVTAEIRTRSGDIEITDGAISPGSSQDGAKPRIYSAVTDDSDNNGFIDQITVTFTEPIDDSNSDLTSTSFSIEAPYTIASIVSGSADDETIVINLDEESSVDTDETPDITITANGLQDLSTETNQNDLLTFSS
ncbi:MAG: hypothetical protein RJQ14_02430, partial [Marinoscillum sp.]